MAVSGVGAVNQDQFLQLLVAQLKAQDPLNPVDDKEFINQLTSLNTLQGIQSLNANFSEMLKLQQLSQGADLIGKTIEYPAADKGPSKVGKVDSVNVVEGKFVLHVGTDNVGLDQITSVKN